MKKLIASLSVLVVTMLLPMSAMTLAFNPFQDVCSQKNAASSPTCQQNKSQAGSTNNPVVKTIQTASNIIATIAGIAAVIVIIISGFMFITAGGNSDTNRIKAARSALVGAIIGLVIIALSWTIVTFVTDKVIG